MKIIKNSHPIHLIKNKYNDKTASCDTLNYVIITIPNFNKRHDDNSIYTKDKRRLLHLSIPLLAFTLD